ncbi:MAG: lipopolysaccharide biosynthesis protein [Halobacteriota archaeon]
MRAPDYVAVLRGVTTQIPHYFKSVRQILRNPLYRSSIFLSSGSIFSIAAGFLFWLLAARTYTVQDVGVATALISALNLVYFAAKFGLDNALIRFFPSEDKAKVLNTCLSITIVASFFVGLAFMLLSSGVNFTSSSVSPVAFAAFFIALACIQSAVYIVSSAFIALRKSHLFFFQNILLALRIPLLLPLAVLGTFGIFGAWGVSFFITAAASFVIVAKYAKVDFRVDTDFLRRSLRFSWWNYVAELLRKGPLLILPILILGLVGPEDAAYYYIVSSIANVLFIIPDALSAALFVEGSHGESLRTNAKKALIGAYALLVPAVALTFVFGGVLLGFFGPDYVQAMDILRPLALSSFFVAIYYIFVPIQNVRMRVESIALLNLVGCVLLLGLAYIFILRFGIVGVGYAWIITYAAIALISVGYARWQHWI